MRLNSGVDVGDAVDEQIEVRSAAELGLVEEAVGDDVGLGDKVAHVVHVGQVLGQGLAVHGEGGGVEDLEGTVGQSGLDFLKLLHGAGSGGLLVDVGDLDGAGRDGAGPVSGDLLAFRNAAHGEADVGSPVDTGSNDEGVGAGVGNAVPSRLVAKLRRHCRQ